MKQGIGTADLKPSPSFGIAPPRLGVYLFIASEIMLFAGLLSAHLVFRLGSPEWPPTGQPRLPVLATLFNTLILLWGGVEMNLAVKALRSGSSVFMRHFRTAAASGIVFLILQGREWLKLIAYGLMASSSVYGGIFYLLVGLHGLHVAGAVGVFGWMFHRLRQGAYTPQDYLGLDLFRVYWNFVVGIWPVLYFFLYF